MPSIAHQVLAAVIPRLRGSAEVVDADALRREIVAARPTTAPAPPTRVRGCDVAPVPGSAFPVYAVTPPGATPGRTVLYLHGGGYVSGADRLHWRYAARLARTLHARVVVPLYPLAPEHTWRDSHEELIALYERVCATSPAGVVLAGDSAGGGYALALAQAVVRRDLPRPSHLLLISPWVDLAGTTPGTEQARARDTWLRLSKLRLYGRWWAGDDDPARPECSPLFGDLAGLPPTLVLCGTRDLLQPQVRALADRAGAAGWDLTYIEKPDLIHVYPILPVPEARPAFLVAVAFLHV